MDTNIEKRKLDMIMGVRNLADELKISRNTVYGYIKRGLPAHRISEKKLVFDLDEVKAWLKSRYEG